MFHSCLYYRQIYLKILILISVVYIVYTSLFEIEEKLTTDNIANKYLVLLNGYNLYLIINNYD